MKKIYTALLCILIQPTAIFSIKAGDQVVCGNVGISSEDESYVHVVSLNIDYTMSTLTATCRGKMKKAQKLAVNGYDSGKMRNLDFSDPAQGKVLSVSYRNYSCPDMDNDFKLRTKKLQWLRVRFNESLEEKLDQGNYNVPKTLYLFQFVGGQKTCVTLKEKAKIDKENEHKAAMEQLIPVYLWYNGQRADNMLATWSHAESLQKAGYSRIRVEGCIAASEGTSKIQKEYLGDRPLVTFYHGGRSDNFNAAAADGINAASGAGYGRIRTDGYIFGEKKKGSIPLKLYYNSQRGDNMSVATKEGIASVTAAGYTFIRDQGYIWPAEKCM